MSAWTIENKGGGTSSIYTTKSKIPKAYRAKEWTTLLYSLYMRVT